MVESFQATATGLYAAEGIIPCAQKYWLIAKTESVRFSPNAGLTRTPMSEDDLERLGSLDQRILGFARPDDHRWWLQSMNGYTYRSGTDLVGYAYVDDGWISPALAVDEPTLVALFMDVAQVVHKDEVETAIFGTSRELFKTLMHSGFRIGPSKYSSVYASTGGALPSSYVLHADWLP
jgi:hypothetical protein